MNFTFLVVQSEGVLKSSRRAVEKVLPQGVFIHLIRAVMGVAGFTVLFSSSVYNRKRYLSCT